MDRFQEMAVFVRIAERHSFTQAADDLRIPRATVTNLIKRIETRLGTRLLERTTRTVRLTLDGEAYYLRCVQLLSELEEADAAFLNAAPSGLLRVNLPSILAQTYVLPRLPEFVERYPGIQFHIGEDDRLIDLVREGVDCVIRVGVLQDSSMIGRRIAELAQVTVASPAYLARFGEPRSLSELQAHRAVNYVSSRSGSSMPMEFTVAGKVVEVPMASVMSVDGIVVYSAAALAGFGMVQVPRYGVAEELAAGRLRVVLSAMPPPPIPVSVLYPQHRQLSSRVRVFAHWLTEVFAEVG